jgi:hypothetical protein
MRSEIRIAAFLLLTAAACATGGGGAKKSGPAERYYPADQRPPEEKAFDEDAERAYIRDARTHEARAAQAATSGNLDQARAEFGAAGDLYATFVDKFPASEWQVALRYHAADLYARAQQWDKAAEQSERIVANGNADERSKALAGRLAALSWLQTASQQAKAGKLDALKLEYAEQRKGEAPKPRTPPGAWKRFVDAADRYLERVDADPETKKPAAERKMPISPAQLALISGEVQFAFDNLEEARRRFEMIFDRWPGEGEAFENAVPHYLQTYVILKDEAGYQAAVRKVRGVAEAQMKAAADPKDQAAYKKALDALGRAEAGGRFASAQKLLEDGKAAEAAQAFEALASGGNGETPIALHNAALAWDKANEPAKATALRQRIVKEYPDSKVTPNNVLLLAAAASKKGDHAEAAKIYGGFLEKYPDSANRCVALQNVAAELDTAKKPVDAAERYLVFGKDEGCAKGDPNFAARALYRSGQLFLLAKKRPQAKEAFTAAVNLAGVTDTVTKSQLEDAKKRLKGL